MAVSWLLVGTGEIVRKRVGAALAETPGSRLQGVCGRDAARVAETALRFGASERFTDLREALDRTQADAVYLATPVAVHATQVRAALEVGKHVLVEKPLGRNAAECQGLAELAASRRLVAGCAYYRRCGARYLHAAELLARGALGTIVNIRMSYASWYAPAAAPWRLSRTLAGGGVLADMGCHMLDVLIGLFGLPRRVSARVATRVHSYEVEDSAAVMLEMADGTPVIGDFLWNSKAWRHELQITGSEATLTWRPYDSGPVEVAAGRERQLLDLSPHDNVHVPLIEDFLEAVGTGRPPACPLEEAVQTNQVMDAIYASAASAGEVRL